MKTIYNKPTASILLSGEKLKAFPLIPGTRQGCPFPATVFQRILEVLATAIQEERQNGSKF